LAAIGPAAFGVIQKAMAGKISSEAKVRTEKILDQDGTQYLKR
jgi:hypothetical protein